MDRLLAAVHRAHSELPIGGVVVDNAQGVVARGEDQTVAVGKAARDGGGVIAAGELEEIRETLAAAFGLVLVSVSLLLWGSM